MAPLRLLSDRAHLGRWGMSTERHAGYRRPGCCELGSGLTGGADDESDAINTVE